MVYFWSTSKHQFAILLNFKIMEIKRYNKLGEWKPIIYGGNTDRIQSDINKLTDDSRVRGILFYAKTTGFNCIEFVMKTNIDLPIKNIASIDNILHIYKCQQWSRIQESVIYDCWLDLNSLDIDLISSELQRIRLAVNRIGIAFRSPIEWCVKYDNINSQPGKGIATEEDINFLNNILTASINKEDLYLIEYAIDWYNQALLAKNPFTKYMCYFTAVETLVTKIADGETEFHPGIDKFSRTEKIECIENLEKEIRGKSVFQFIHDSYDKCLKSINRKFTIILPYVLGNKHWSIKTFFEGNNSLMKIRNKITHGEFSLYNDEHKMIVEKSLNDIADLSREFILRLLLKKQSKDKLEEWGNNFIASFSMSDPRITMVCSSEKILPTTEWKIKPEWCT